MTIPKQPNPREEKVIGKGTKIHSPACFTLGRDCVCQNHNTKQPNPRGKILKSIGEILMRDKGTFTTGVTLYYKPYEHAELIYDEIISPLKKEILSLAARYEYLKQKQNHDKK